MNKKAAFGDLQMSTVIFLIILVLLVGGMSFVIFKQREGVGIWEQYYSQEVARVVNMAKPGDEITIDVNKATEIALDNGVRFSDIFNFNNVNNEVQVKLSHSGVTSYKYFNEVDIVEWKVELDFDDFTNKLHFKVREAS